MWSVKIFDYKPSDFCMDSWPVETPGYPLSSFSSPDIALDAAEDFARKQVSGLSEDYLPGSKLYFIAYSDSEKNHERMIEL